MQKAILIAVVVIAVVVMAWALWPRGGEESPPEPEAIEAPPKPVPPAERLPTHPTPEETATPPPEVVLPPLQESDAFVRERLDPMDLPEPWIEQGDYVRRLAVLAENASRGELPRRQLAFLAPRGQFQVTEENDRAYVDPVSYERYDGYIEQLETVDPERLAGLLDTLNPLVEGALAEIGVEAPPGEVFEAAVREVLEVPVLEGEIELVQPNVMYEYADPELESLSPLKKQVLRMGPENVRRLQTYLRRLAVEMELDVPS